MVLHLRGRECCRMTSLANDSHHETWARLAPVCCTPGLRRSATRKKCNKTCSKSQCTGRWSCRSFWTEASKHKGHTYSPGLAASRCRGRMASHEAVTLSKASKPLGGHGPSGHGTMVC